jgi:hypothetical protein
MRSAVVAMAMAAALLGFGAAARAQHYEPAVPPGAVYGVGCYWFRAKQYCNRYCYLEVDGYYFCHRRLEVAGSQAPRPVVVVRPPYRYVPRAPYAPRPYGPPPHGRTAPRH